MPTRMRVSTIPIGTRLVLALVSAALAACGGSGGSDSASGERLVLSKNVVELTAPVTSGANLEEGIAFTVENQSSSSNFINVTHTDNGLRSVSSRRNVDDLEILLQFKTPLDLRPGVYEDQVRLNVCADGTCSQFVENLSAIITSRLTIVGTNDISAEVSVDELNLHAFVTDPFVPDVNDLGLAVAGVTTFPFVEVTSTQNAVIRVGGFMTEVTSGFIRYSLPPPAELGPGVYEDTLSVRACLDRNCVNPIPPFPITIPLQLTISDTQEGPNGYSVKVTDIRGTAMAWDETRQVIYSAQPDRSGFELDHNIAVVDPAAGVVTNNMPIAWRPGPMAISGDDQYLYIGDFTEGQLRRIRLSDLAVDASVDLGTTADSAPYNARELAVAPSVPDIVGMARSIHPGGEVSAGVVVFENMVPRSEIVGADPDLENGPVIDHIAWGLDAARIFASKQSREDAEIYDIAVDSNGGQLLSTTPIAALGRLHFSDGFLYTDNGMIIDTATFTQVATLVPEYEATTGEILRVLVDADSNRVYAIARFLEAPRIGFFWPIRLVSFDLLRRTQIASVPLNPDLSYGQALLKRWGHDGLVLLAIGEDLVFINGPFVTP